MKLKGKIKIIILIITITLALFFILGGTNLYKEFILNKRLEKLSFNQEAITAIKSYEISDYILENELYSKTLEEALLSSDFNKDCLEIYVDIEYDEQAKTVSSINTLYNLGYKEEEIVSIFRYLDSEEVISLTSKEYIEDILSYISVDYFKMDNLDRYLSYKNNNKETEYKQVITYVNIGLDNPFYESIKTVSNPTDYLVLVNKYNKLPNDYEPNDLELIDTTFSSGYKYLRKVAKEAFCEMARDAYNVGLHLNAVSAYRDYNYQYNLYNHYVSTKGKTGADLSSARAGHSEHQTGLAVDVASSDNSYTQFSKTNEYAWVKHNAHNYGFIIRYEEGKESITGYKYEAWHLRYVGKEVATYIYNNDLTFDEYYVMFIE